MSASERSGWGSSTGMIVGFPFSPLNAFAKKKYHICIFLKRQALKGRLLRLTVHTDYALRVLMTLAVLEDGRLATIEELADRHRISRNHLMKVAQTLVGLGLVKSVRGRRGGLALAVSPQDIRMGSVVRMLESDMELVACLGNESATCALTGLCRLTGAFRGAIDAFFAELDRLTLADLVLNRRGLRRRMAIAS